MLDLTDLSILLLFAACAAWLWRGHGIRERALALVRRHCEKVEVILLDDNVALQRLRLLRDARGQRRLARVYGFEFTVTGEQRHIGSISMFGQHLGKIELAAHPFSVKADSTAPVAESFSVKANSTAPVAHPFPAKAHSDAPVAESFPAKAHSDAPVAESFPAKAHSDAPVAELFSQPTVTAAATATPLAEPLPGQATSAAPRAEVIQLSDWRQRHSGSDKLH